MAATKAFISARVGEGGRTRGNDVSNLQRLLVAAGQEVKGGVDGRWGDNTKNALLAYQRKYNPQALATSPVPVRPYVDPEDLVLLQAAWEGQMLIPLSGSTGAPGCRFLQQWFERMKTKYNAGAERGLGNRAIYGVEGRPDWAIQTTGGIFQQGPVEMDCTIYVNLMLSVYTNGQCHATPYDASCADYGGVSSQHCARDRYRFPLVTRNEGGKSHNYFQTAEQIAAATAESRNLLYALEVGSGGTGAVTHMALLYNGNVYECTTGQKDGSCIGRPLEKFMENKSNKLIYLFGPK